MPNENFEFIMVKRELKTKSKLQQLADLISKEEGRPCPVYFAAETAITEAIERRKKAKAGQPK